MLYLRKSHTLTVRHAVRLLTTGNRCNSRDYTSSDDEKSPQQSKTKQEKSDKKASIQEFSLSEESASAKLNRLLASMLTADDKLSFSKRVDVVARPGEASKKKRQLQKQELESKDIFAAAKKVASLLGEDKQQQTESELLTRLLGGKTNTSSTTTEKQNLAAKEGDVSLSELIVGMKIDRRQPQKDAVNTRSEFVRRSLAARGRSQRKTQEDMRMDKRPLHRKREAEVYTGSVNLFGGDPLGIFNDTAALKDSKELLPTWSYLNEQALKVQVAHPPSNYFDKIAKWTEQGKVWRFPIDNEQDWLDEKDVDFSEHIFLEQYLEDWCPNRGPVRHFMELVCVGLSKNPYITAKEKKDHIIWYKNYFESKRDILRELMSNDLKDEKSLAEKNQSQVEA